MCMCPDQKVGRQLILHRGLHPVVLDPADAPASQADAVELAKNAGFCKAGDTVLVAYRDHASPAKDLALKILVVRRKQRSRRFNDCLSWKGYTLSWKGYTRCMPAHSSNVFLFFIPRLSSPLDVADGAFGLAFDPSLLRHDEEVAPAVPIPRPPRSAFALCSCLCWR